MTASVSRKGESVVALASFRMRHDRFAGHPATSHGELTIRVVALFEAEKAGFDVAAELAELIAGWEAGR